MPDASLEKKHAYTEAEIELSLQALAICAGNARQAVKRLEELTDEDREQLGIEKFPEHQTLYRWKTKHAERYEEIRSKALEKYREEAAEAHSALSDRQMSMAHKILDKAEGRLEAMDDKATLDFLNKVNIGAGIHRQRAGEIRGEGTPRVNFNFNFGEQARGLAARGARFFDDDGNELSVDEVIKRQQSIPGTATEVSSA